MTTKPDTEALPDAALKIKAMDLIVRFFPRRLFAFMRPRVEDKYVFHPLLLSRPPAVSDPGLPETWRFSPLNDELLVAMRKHKEALPADVYRARLAKGDACYCLEVAGKLVAYQWIATANCSVFRGFEREIVFLQLQPGQAFTYDFYTYRDCRRQGFGSLLKKHVYRTLAANGVTEVLSCVLPGNRESRNIHMREGFALKALPYNFRIMDWSTTLWGDRKSLDATAAWWERCAKTLR